MCRKREDDCQQRTEATDMQKAKFGVEGELFQKRQELIQPSRSSSFRCWDLAVSAVHGHLRQGLGQQHAVHQPQV